jgi:hypothetical protein
MKHNSKTAGAGGVDTVCEGVEREKFIHDALLLEFSASMPFNSHQEHQVRQVTDWKTQKGQYCMQISFVTRDPFVLFTSILLQLLFLLLVQCKHRIKIKFLSKFNLYLYTLSILITILPFSLKIENGQSKEQTAHTTMRFVKIHL